MRLAQSDLMTHVKNGFKKAGITSAVENGVELAEDLLVAESSESEDPLALVMSGVVTQMRNS